MTAQLAEVDAAMPTITATKDAEFAITIGGQRYTERAAVAPALLNSVMDAYGNAKYAGASRQFSMAELHGVGV